MIFDQRCTEASLAQGTKLAYNLYQLKEAKAHGPASTQRHLFAKLAQSSSQPGVYLGISRIHTDNCARHVPGAAIPQSWRREIAALPQLLGPREAGELARGATSMPQSHAVCGAVRAAAQKRAEQRRQSCPLRNRPQRPARVASGSLCPTLLQMIGIAHWATPNTQSRVFHRRFVRSVPDVVKDSESPNTEPFATTKATPQGIRNE